MDRLLFFLAKLFVKGSDPKSEVKPCAIYDKQNVSINKMQLEIWESFIQKVLAKCRHMCTKQCSTSTDFSSSISKVPTLSLYHNLGLRNNTLLRGLPPQHVQSWGGTAHLQTHQSCVRSLGFDSSKLPSADGSHHWSALTQGFPRYFIVCLHHIYTGCSEFLLFSLNTFFLSW